MKLGRCLACLLLLTMVACASAKAQSIENPVLNHDFPDPTVINVGGKYYGYATNSVVKGKYEHVQLATSTDLQHWTDVGDALPNGATWAKRDYWAPHVVYDGQQKKYILFFSARSASSDADMCIGVATADNPEGPFIDKGKPLIAGKGFANIDPFAMIDPKSGKKLLYWGSDHQPIKVQELSDNWLEFKTGSTAKPVQQPALEKNYTSLIEGAWVDYNKGYYYLYYSGDNCCGPHANYAVLVSRSKSPFGPFTRFGEANGSNSSVILEKDSKWNAPGHNSIFRSDKKMIYIAYHAIPAGGGPRVLLIKSIVYKNNWPVVINK